VRRGSAPTPRDVCCGVVQFCPNIEPGNARAKECLEQHRDDPKFSEGCRKEVIAMMEFRAADYRLDAQLREVCRDVIEDECAPAVDELDAVPNYEATVIECLQEYRFLHRPAQRLRSTFCSVVPPCLTTRVRLPNSTPLAWLVRPHSGISAVLRDEIKDEACADRVRQTIQRAASDIRFDVPLADACADDRRKLCDGVQPGSAMVIRCLQNKCVFLGGWGPWESAGPPKSLQGFCGVRKEALVHRAPWALRTRRGWAGLASARMHMSAAAPVAGGETGAHAGELANCQVRLRTPCPAVALSMRGWVLKASSGPSLAACLLVLPHSSIAALCQVAGCWRGLSGVLTCVVIWLAPWQAVAAVVRLHHDPVRPRGSHGGEHRLPVSTEDGVPARPRKVLLQDPPRPRPHHTLPPGQPDGRGDDIGLQGRHCQPRAVHGHRLQVIQHQPVLARSHPSFAKLHSRLSVYRLAESAESCDLVARRLNVRLAESCDATIKDLCKDVCKKDEELDKPCGGKVLRCLTDKVEKITAETCLKEVEYFEKMEIRDFRNDIILAEACRADVESMCANVKPGGCGSRVP
jgi:Cysteine rich repeat